ncbi:hypothetical protein TNCV_3488341 [Trichonephila clavipes]|nr:hypothetical protein TNCV_3488341 [Trichonephila clavipes]
MEYNYGMSLQLLVYADDMDVIQRRDETSRNITARVIERDTSGWIYYFLEDSEGFELANMVANDAKMVTKNDANLALPPRFRQVLIELPL